MNCNGTPGNIFSDRPSSDSGPLPASTRLLMCRVPLNTCCAGSELPIGMNQSL
jgi:hypothetical protein